jgi:TolB-like protein/cytochrome c-type biogenesis protein CcmH/NrfG
MSEPPRAVFISYASEDEEAARRICDSHRRIGHEVWFDQHALRGGDAWDQRIRREIRDCALFIPIISANTQARLEGYFRREWKLAIERTHDMAEEKAFLLPVVLDETSPLQASVPEPFRAVHWTHLVSGTVPAAFVARVSQLLSTIQSGNPPAARRAPVAAPGFHPVPSPSSGTLEHSIAVLPFVNMSADKEQEYFSDGLAEELINLLAKIPELRVPARTSSFSFRGRPVTAGEIGQALNVAHVLEGSVRKAGNRLRITVQLVRTDNGYHLWSETFDRTLDDIFQIQDDIAHAVVDKLRLTLLTPVPSASRLATNTEAHNLYLQGQYFRGRETQADLDKAVDCYQRALALDANYARAWAGLSAVYTRQVANSYVALDHGFTLIRAAAEKAIALDPTLGDAYSSLVVVLVNIDHDWPGSVAHLARARALDPTNPLVLLSTAIIGRNLGNAEEAVTLLRQALDRDPLNLLVRRYFARTLYYANRLAEAEAEIRQVLELSAAYPVAHYELGRILLAQGKVSAAVAAFENEATPGWRKFGLPLGYQAQGRAAEAQAALEAMLRESTGGEFQIAEACACLGDDDQAFRWLNAAVANRDPGIMWLRDDPLLKGLTGDPRYLALLRTLNLPP